MVRITNSEGKLLRKLVPGVHIRGTANKLYAENSRIVLELLTNNEEAKEMLRELQHDSADKFQHVEE